MWIISLQYNTALLQNSIKKKKIIASSLTCFNIFYFKALRQERQIWEAMKRSNVERWLKTDSIKRPVKHLFDGAMKRLTLAAKLTFQRSWCSALLKGKKSVNMRRQWLAYWSMALEQMY
jgi:hypothetical protein